MKTSMKFDECLHSLLSSLDISINRLSKVINVDCSLVNRWIHGKRIPSYHTTYTESIAEYLSKNIQNSIQMQHLNELFLKVCGCPAAESSTKDKIKRILAESQGYSLECKKKDMKERKDRSPGKDQSAAFSDSYPPDGGKEKDAVTENFTWNTDQVIPSVDLSKDDKVIIGREHVLSAALSLLEASALHRCGAMNTIYISLDNDTDITSSRNRPIPWRNMVLKAIHSGWNILFLLKLNSNIGRTIQFICFSLPLIKTGKFNPYYFKKYDDFTAGKEMLIIPEVGALSCITTQPHSQIDSAFYLKNRTAVDMFKSYFHVLLTTSAQPLIRYYTPDDTPEYIRCLTESEESMGSRFLYKYGFSIITLPENLYKKLLKRKKLPQEERQKALEFYKRRLNAFLLNIMNFEYRDIYPANSVKNLVLHRQFYFYSHQGMDIVDMEIPDIIEHLQHILRLLKKYNNYKIAFVHQDLDPIVGCIDSYCLVKERQAVVLEACGPFTDVPEVRVSIEEPTLVKAFEEYFKGIWEQIAPVNKDKKEIMKWLQSQIDFLKNSGAS